MDQKDQSIPLGCYRAEVIFIRFDLRKKLAGVTGIEQAQRAVVDYAVFSALFISLPEHEFPKCFLITIMLQPLGTILRVSCSGGLNHGQE